MRRTAWLLTGDRALAEDLVQTALVRSWPRWEKPPTPCSRNGAVAGIVPQPVELRPAQAMRPRTVISANCSPI
jgi:hypothetical protein